MKLSVVIASYNTKEILGKTLTLLQKQLTEQFKKDEYEIIIIDNNSTDGTKEWLHKQKEIVSIQNRVNKGFGAANNQGIARAKGKYVLLLNSDVHLTTPVHFVELIEFLREDPRRAVLTIKLMLNETRMDAACHRGFPTPWNSFLYFSKLEKVFGGTYHLTKLPLDTAHEIDCPSAAFLLIKKEALISVEGFDEAFFFYAEDIDLCYRLKQKKWTIWFYPLFQATHLKYQSGKKGKNMETSKHSRWWFYKSMGMYYEKHEAKNRNDITNFIVRKVLKIAENRYI